MIAVFSRTADRQQRANPRGSPPLSIRTSSERWLLVPMTVRCRLSEVTPAWHRPRCRSLPAGRPEDRVTPLDSRSDTQSDTLTSSSGVCPADSAWVWLIERSACRPMNCRVAHWVTHTALRRATWRRPDWRAGCTDWKTPESSREVPNSCRYDERAVGGSRLTQVRCEAGATRQYSVSVGETYCGETSNDSSAALLTNWCPAWDGDRHSYIPTWIAFIDEQPMTNTWTQYRNVPNRYRNVCTGNKRCNVNMG